MTRTQSEYPGTLGQVTCSTTTSSTKAARLSLGRHHDCHLRCCKVRITGITPAAHDFTIRYPGTRGY
eukprot:1547646-Rhodomonas_salina.5